MDSNILQTVKETDELAVLELAQQHNVDQIRTSDEYDTEEMTFKQRRETNPELFNNV